MALTAQDNAHIEPPNSTIKEEYLDFWRPETFLQLRSMVKKLSINTTTEDHLNEELFH